jgi:hypothetical protein
VVARDRLRLYHASEIEAFIRLQEQAREALEAVEDRAVEVPGDIRGVIEKGVERNAHRAGPVGPG